MIRNGNYDDLEQIVYVHKNSFNGFFLTLLGDLFLKELYKGFLDSPLGILRVACNNDGDIIGFSAGTISPEKFFQQLRMKKGLKFAFLCLPCLFNKPFIVLRKVYSAIFYKGDSVASLSKSALLSSIAVEPSYSGQSIGKRLLIDFEIRVTMSDSCTSIYLITDGNDNQRVIDFYLSYGYMKESEFLQTGGRNMLRLVKEI